MNEHTAPGESKRASIPWMAIFTVAAFIGGNLVNMTMGYSTRSAQLDTLTTEVARLTGSVTALAEKYTNTDKSTSNELQKIQDHLTYNDTRLDKMELQIQERRVK